MTTKLHKITLRVDIGLLTVLETYSTSIASSIRMLLQLALEKEYASIYDPNYIERDTVYHITTRVDPFINNMIKEYASVNDVSTSESTRRLLNLVITKL